MINLLNEYEIIRNLIDPKICYRLAERIKEREELDKFHYDDQCLISPAFDGQLDDLAEFVRSKISQYLNQQLFNTYNYCRIYKSGEILEPHKDKNQCEVAVSLTLHTDNEKIWPIWLYSNQEQKSVEVILNVGDVLIYKGYELLHWRNKFNGPEEQIQAFLFYATDERFQDPFFPGIEKLIKKDYTWLL